MDCKTYWAVEITAIKINDAGSIVANGMNEILCRPGQSWCQNYQSAPAPSYNFELMMNGENRILSSQYWLHVTGADRVIKRRIRRKEKTFLSRKGYGSFMYALNQYFRACQANTGKDRAGEWNHHFLCQLILLLNYGQCSV